MTTDQWIEAERHRILVEAGRIPSSWGAVAGVVFRLALGCLIAVFTANAMGHFAPSIHNGRACWFAPGYVWPISGIHEQWVCSTVEPE